MSKTSTLRGGAPTKILIVEDQTLVREAMGNLLSLEDDIEVVGLAQNGHAALALLSQQAVDVVLTDIEMPEMSGLALAEQLQVNYPDVRVMIMTTFSKSGYIKRSMATGVKAFILKEAPVDYLLQAIARVVEGQRVIEPELALMALEDNDPLSRKERQALSLAGEGKKTAEIAETMHLSEGTIRNYLSEAISKLNAGNRIDAARIARQKGWIY